jgi:MFS family permease
MSEFRHELIDLGGWRILIACAVGIGFGLTTLPFYTVGVFTKPLAEEFAWSRAQVQAGLTWMMIGTVTAAWLIGLLMDRFGVRAVALWSQFGLALGLVGVGLVQGHIVLWYSAWFFMAVLGVGTSPITWTRGVADVFDKSRGLALGLALMSTGAMGIVLPPALTWVVETVGWRFAYFTMALSIVLFAMPVVYFFLKPPSDNGHSDVSGAQSNKKVVVGVTFKEALHSYQFWVLMIAFLLIAGSVAGLIINLIPILTDGGLEPGTAASYASFIGLSIILGRLLIGLLLDRVWAPYVTFAVVILPAVAAILIAMSPSGLWWIPLSACFIGFAAGAEFDLIAYMCSRYFGMKSYGQIYAWQWASFSLAAGVAPPLFGQVYDGTGSYEIALYSAAVALIVGGLMLFSLGRYPIFTARSSS